MLCGPRFQHLTTGCKLTTHIIYVRSSSDAIEFYRKYHYHQATVA